MASPANAGEVAHGCTVQGPKGGIRRRGKVLLSVLSASSQVVESSGLFVRLLIYAFPLPSRERARERGGHKKRTRRECIHACIQPHLDVHKQVA